ncbi:unnamed protein product, partial [Heterosigma akashiwo]
LCAISSTGLLRCPRTGGSRRRCCRRWRRTTTRATRPWTTPTPWPARPEGPG